jgi:hypothetical protein
MESFLLFYTIPISSLVEVQEKATALASVSVQKVW